MQTHTRTPKHTTQTPRVLILNTKYRSCVFVPPIVQALVSVLVGLFNVIDCHGFFSLTAAGFFSLTPTGVFVDCHRGISLTAIGVFVSVFLRAFVLRSELFVS